MVIVFRHFLQLAGKMLQRFDYGHQTAVQMFTKGGEDDIPPFVRKKRNAQLLFQSSDGLTERRLGDMQFFGCPGNMLAFGRRAEIFQLHEFHDLVSFRHGNFCRQNSTAAGELQ